MENLVLFKFDQKLTFLALHMYKNAQNIDLYRGIKELPHNV